MSRSVQYTLNLDRGGDSRLTLALPPEMGCLFGLTKDLLGRLHRCGGAPPSWPSPWPTQFCILTLTRLTLPAKHHALNLRYWLVPVRLPAGCASASPRRASFLWFGCQPLPID